MTYNSKIDVVILAGAPAGVELNPDDATISRAMIDIAGKTMLQWVVDALRGASLVGRIAAVGNVKADGLDMVVKPGDNMVANIKLGTDALKTDSHVLIVSGDIPLLTGEAVDDFIRQAAPLEVDLAVPILSKECCEERYPEMARTYLTTADGVLTTGNIMLMGPGFIDNHWAATAKAYAARKHVFELARMIGMGVLARVLLAKAFPSILKVSTLEQAVARVLSAKVAAVMSEYPEIGEDVDKPSDLAGVRAILSSTPHAQP